MATEPAAPTELEPDNSTRLAIFDAVSDAVGQGKDALTLDELHARVIGRLRVLVPRELHNAGEQAYVAEKVGLCVKAGVLERLPGNEDRYTIAEDPQVWIRYPDETIRRYTYGLTAARERLDAANAALRANQFDVRNHLPHLGADDPKFRALVSSMQEHGFLRQFSILRYPDGKFVDGISREAAAEEAGVEARYQEVDKLPKPAPTAIRRRDTPLTRVLLAVDCNAFRLTDEQRREVLNKAAAVTGKSWQDIDTDLVMTRPWRLASGSSSYTPIFQVEELPFGDDHGPGVLVTADRKVGVRSLLRASGQAEYERAVLREYVARWEEGRPESKENGKRKGPSKATHFAAAADLLEGINDMLKDKRRRKDPAHWQGAIDWLERYISS
ncbi:MAG: hypothetical protein ACLP0J_10955 [Solirubrobacteraceae bacterium]